MKNSRACVFCQRPPKPEMVTVVPSCATPQPNCRKAASITRVSSESSRSWTTVVPSHRAESSSTGIWYQLSSIALATIAVVSPSARPAA